MILSTVRIHHPNDPDVMMIINESDLRDDHVLWGSLAAEVLTVGKGPRGKFYVKCGKELVSEPFDTEADAHAALELM